MAMTPLNEARLRKSAIVKLSRKLSGWSWGCCAEGIRMVRSAGSGRITMKYAHMR